MKRSLLPAALVAVALLTGCSMVTGSDTDTATAGTPTLAPSPGPSASPTPSAVSGLGAVKDSGDLPDPCTLLTDAQVVELTGRKITQQDEDGAAPGTTTRFCQWQQSGGQLVVFVSRTTASDYEVKIKDATPVNDLGDKAFQLAGHLYVLYGTVQLDVYSSGQSDEENMETAKRVVEVLLPKV
ncbi:DUF3558 family protein [Actinoplanes sp. NPDC051633]|uniref:DUF3558 family protein n=1 Tax=Actinoplanes sp. NPDC051633 TaxID=3155670 RepID=UPI00342FC155